MVTTPKQKAWARAIAKPALEFDPTPLSIISGAIPTNLRGTLYRNGPARLSRGGERVGHWFDGDGAILGVHFKDDGATGVYRYVQTQGYLDEQEKDTFIYPNYGMTAKGAFWNNWFKPVKNAANTSVLALPDCLLALWEGGKPHSLDLETLATFGIDERIGLTDKQNFSAHPKVDSTTGEIFNYGVNAGANVTLNLYRCDCSGKLQQYNSHILSGLPIIHDFCLAGQYMVFLISPVRVNLTPILLGQKSYSEAMEWQPELGTEILIFDRNNLSLVGKEVTEPWFQWHFSNGCVNSEGNIVTEFIRYDNFDTNQYLKEVASGYTQTVAKGTLWELTIEPQTAKVINNQQLCELQGEFALVAPQDVGKPWRYTYLNVHNPDVPIDWEIYQSIARFDRQTSSVKIVNMGENCYSSEPVLVPEPNSSDRGWLLNVVYDGNSDRSEVRIYQSDLASDIPVCRLALPKVIPHGFHGTWRQD